MAALEIQIIAVVVSIACALPGSFLALRKMSMMSDSITHTILLGIVLAFFATRDLNSPYLIVGAALTGVLTVWLTETLARTRLLSEDSAVGIVFPLLFSIAIILVTRFADSVHLDTDSVLMGELAFAPFERMVVGGLDIGPKALYTSGALLLLNALFVAVFFKELKLASFDPTQAAVLGFSPVLLHYGLMTLVSLTAVGAFEAVGSVLVVAFMIGPPITAYLLTDDLKTMLLLSAAFGAGSGILGFQLAYALDVSIAGMMAVVTGALFLLTSLLAPQRGLLSALLRKRRQRRAYAEATLLLHVCGHWGTAVAREENGIRSIARHLHWEQRKTERVTEALIRSGRLRLCEDVYAPTERGLREAAEIERSLSK